jgi:ribosomal protein S18 acetylase RimI-like enzyme
VSLPAIDIRAATSADIPAICRLHAQSLRRLGRGHYDAAILERIIASGTFQPALLRGGRYKVARLGDRLVGCGGWLEGGPAAPFAIPPASLGKPAPDGNAVVRAVYVDPDLARHGIGRSLMAVIEAEMRAAGKELVTLLSTVMAVRFYSRLGYAVERPLTLAINGTGSGDEAIEVFAMTKVLPVPVAAEAVASSPEAAAATDDRAHLPRAA